MPETTTTTLGVPVAANQTTFLGEWNNTNPSTAGIVSLQVTMNGGFYYIHAWGACAPTACDWGQVPLYLYSPAPYGDTTVYYANAVYNLGYGTKYLTLQFSAPGTLQVFTLTHYTDSSGRLDNYSTDTFYQP